MFCKNCGAELAENAAVCEHCGTELAAQKPVYVAPAPQPTAVYAATKEIPEENRPLSPWAYFGLSLLFSIPVVGFVFLIVFSFNGSNINRRNYARSYWCGLLIAVIILAIVAIIGIAGGSVLDEVSRF